MSSAVLPPVFTIGHSTRSVEGLVELLRVGAVSTVVDIRRFPRSHANPQFNIEVLPDALAPLQIGYARIEALGGLRAKSGTVGPEINGYWTNRSFHNYADYALSDMFRAGLEELEQLSRRQRVAIMCSEAVWWRCHRRFVADYLLRDGREVFHLMDPFRANVARMTPAARPCGNALVYPGEDVPDRS